MKNHTSGCDVLGASIADVTSLPFLRSAPSSPEKPPEKTPWYRAPIWYIVGGIGTILTGFIAYSEIDRAVGAQPKQRAGEDYDHYLARYGKWADKKNVQVKKDLMKWRAERGLSNEWAK